MREKNSKDGLTLNVIAGTHSVLLAFDLDKNLLTHANGEPCLGFSIWRTGPRGERRPLPNLLSFPSATTATPRTTDFAPLQKFRWGDYTTDPDTEYTYEVAARYGVPGKKPGETGGLATGSTVTVTIKTENPKNPQSAVFFNRGAASSRAFNNAFPNITADEIESNNPVGAAARQWLSRGLEEALIEYIHQAKKGEALLAAIYEFQKPEFLQALADAQARGVDVRVVYHGERKSPLSDETWLENAEMAHKFGLEFVSIPRRLTGAIMHNKFVVHLTKVDSKLKAQSVWTGSTNWTHGAVYGQLNVGHIVYDPKIAEAYEDYFGYLWRDMDLTKLREKLGEKFPVSASIPTNPGVYPIFSPQSNQTMLDVYTQICAEASCLMICAPFSLAEQIRLEINKNTARLRYFLVDKKKNVDNPVEEVDVQDNDVSTATTLQSPLYDMQGRLLFARESFQHRGIHIHSKIILADPFGTNPTLVTGSANFSPNSTTQNDSNSLLLRGHSGAVDIYLTEFMRMFDHYQFRSKRAAAEKAAAAAGGVPKTLNLAVDGSWTNKYFDQTDTHFRERMMFAGTLAS